MSSQRATSSSTGGLSSLSIEFGSRSGTEGSGMYLKVFSGFFLVDSCQAAHFPLEPMEPAPSSPLTSPSPGRSLLTLNMNSRRISRQSAPHLELMTEENELATVPLTQHSPFTPVTLYSSTPITRPRLAWSEEQALRDSLETAFIGLDLRAQSLVENSHPPQNRLTRRSRSPSVVRLEVEEHTRERKWWNEGRRREGARERPRQGSTASARGRGTTMKSLNVADSSRRRERN